MTVKELIEKLQKLPPDIDVVVYSRFEILEVAEDVRLGEGDYYSNDKYKTAEYCVIDCVSINEVSL